MFGLNLNLTLVILFLLVRRNHIFVVRGRLYIQYISLHVIEHNARRTYHGSPFRDHLDVVILDVIKLSVEESLSSLHYILALFQSCPRLRRCRTLDT